MAHVLVIDDSHNICSMLDEILTLEGHTVATAADGQEGLRLIQQTSQRSIILLDLVMPRMSGVDLMKALQAKPELRAKHAVILCDARHNLEQVGGELEVDGWLPKPFTVEQLLDAIERGEQVIRSRSNGTARGPQIH